MITARKPHFSNFLTSLPDVTSLIAFLIAFLIASLISLQEPSTLSATEVQSTEYNTWHWISKSKC